MTRPEKTLQQRLAAEGQRVVGPQLFTAEDDHGASFLAKQACEMCDVRAECIADALLDDARAGIRGGFPVEQIRRDLGGVSGLAAALGRVAS